jgi:hypothetical protein
LAEYKPRWRSRWRRSGGEDLYPTLADKAAALGFALVQGHAFIGGNKRIGHAAMEAFLMLKGMSWSNPWMNRSERSLRRQTLCARNSGPNSSPRSVLDCALELDFSVRATDLVSTTGVHQNPIDGVVRVGQSRGLNPGSKHSAHRPVDVAAGLSNDPSCRTSSRLSASAGRDLQRSARVDGRREHASETLEWLLLHAVERRAPGRAVRLGKCRLV